MSGAAGRPEPLRHQVAVVLRARVLTSILDTATIVLAVRLVGKQDFGVLQLLLLVYEFGRFVVTFGFPDSLYYFSAKLPAPQRRALALRTFSILGGAGLLMALCLLAAAAVVPGLLPEWSPHAQAEVAFGLPILALVALLELPTWGVYPWLVATEQGRVAGRFEVATSLGAMAALVLPLAFGFGVHGVLYGLLVYAAGRALLAAAILIPRLPAAGEPLPEGFFRMQSTYAVPLGLHTVVGRLNKSIDKLIVGALLAETLLAEYGVASTEIPIVTVFPYAVGSVLLSRYVRALHGEDRPGAHALWMAAATHVALLVLPAGVFAIVAAEDVVVAIAGDGYRAAAVPFALVASLLLLRVVQYGAMLQALDDTAGILRITLVTVAINVAVSIPLTLSHGIVGTAAGTVMAQWIGWWLYVRRIQHGLQIPLSQVLPWLHMAKVLGVALLAAGAALALRRFALADVDSVLSLLAMAIVFVPGYLMLAQLLGVIDRGAWTMARAIVLGVPTRTGAAPTAGPDPGAEP